MNSTVALNLGKKSERAKIYLILGLSVVLILVVYFRFIHKKTTQGPIPLPNKDSFVPLAVPQVLLPAVQEDERPKNATQGLNRSVLRDIFAPVEAPPPEKDTQPQSQETAKPAVPLKLKGTIIGGDNDIAIINTTFVYPGDTISGYHVVKISKDKVVLKSGNQTMVLRVLQAAKK